MSLRARQRGLSVGELLVALAVAASLAAVGVPALRSVVLDARRVAVLNALAGSLHAARQAAALRGRDVVLCPVRGPQCAPDGDWREGWMVFVNTDGDTPPARDAGEPLLLRRRTGAAPGTLRANRDAFTFRPGTVRDTNGTLAWCDPRGPAAARALVVSVAGRVRLSARPEIIRQFNCPS